MTEPPSGEATDPSDAAALAGAMDGLSQIVAGSGSVKELLTVVARFAAEAVPGADGAGVTMTERGQQDTIVASDTFVSDVDGTQYRLGEGPCISASALARTTVSGELGSDARWPTFGRHAAESGIHSVISLPLVVSGEVLGSLNVYARAANAFDRQAVAMGEKFAVPAAVAVHNARLLRQTQRANRELRAESAVQSTINQAVGMVMDRSGVDAADAFVQLRIVSQQENREVAAVAAELVESFPGSTATLAAHQREGSGRIRHALSATIVCDATAPAAARAHVRQVLADHEVDEDTTSDAEILVSEVVTNVVRHERPPSVRIDVDVGSDRAVTVTVTGGGASPSEPPIRSTGPPPPDHETGRGLGILDSLAWAWGMRRQFRRTVLWFTVREPPRTLPG